MQPNWPSSSDTWQVPSIYRKITNTPGLKALNLKQLIHGISLVKRVITEAISIDSARRCELVHSPLDHRVSLRWPDEEPVHHWHEYILYITNDHHLWLNEWWLDIVKVQHICVGDETDANIWLLGTSLPVRRKYINFIRCICVLASEQQSWWRNAVEFRMDFDRNRVVLSQL